MDEGSGDQSLCDQGAVIASAPFLSPLRYPGGKNWLRNDISLMFASLRRKPKFIVEPFAGGASISLHLLINGFVDSAILNDLDAEVANFWKVVFNSRSNIKLRALIEHSKDGKNFHKEFFESAPEDNVERAFLFLVKNRVSRGGVVAPGAGLLKRGESDRGLLSRWYPETLCSRLITLCALRFKVSVYCEDALAVLQSDLPSALLFIDPPYTTSRAAPGTRLYTHNAIDLEEVLGVLRHGRAPWILTEHYDEAIINLSNKFKTKSLIARVKSSHNVYNNELVLASKHFDAALAGKFESLSRLA